MWLPIHAGLELNHVNKGGPRCPVILILWANSGLLSTGPLGTNCSEIQLKYQTLRSGNAFCWYLSTENIISRDTVYSNAMNHDVQNALFWPLRELLSWHHTPWSIRCDLFEVRAQVDTSTVYWCMASNLKALRNLFLNEKIPLMCGFICLQYMYYIHYRRGFIIV